MAKYMVNDIDNLAHAVEMYNSGRYSLAARLLRPFADSGVLTAIEILGMMYMHGMHWFDDEASYHNFFREEHQNHRDFWIKNGAYHAESLQLLDRASQLGSKDASYILANYYFETASITGNHVDAELASRYLEKCS